MHDALYRVIFDAVSDALIVIDDEQHFVAANASACDIFGVSLEELLTRTLSDFLKSNSTARTRQWKQPFRDKGQQQGEITLRRPDGTFLDVEYRTTSEIAPHRHLSILRPLTERQRAQAIETRLSTELSAQRIRLKGILTSVPGVVWEAWGEPDGASQRIDFVSDYVEAMLGYRVEEWLQTPNFWLSLVHPEDRERAARTAAKGFASGTGYIDEFRWITKDGRTLWVEARAVIIKDDVGRAVGMRGVTFDISARKQAQQDLQLSEERFRFLFEQSPVGMQILKPDGKTVRVNRAWEELWGLTLEQIKDYKMLEDQQLVEKGIMPYLMRAFAGQPISLPEAYYDPKESLNIAGGRARWTRPIAYPLQSKGTTGEGIIHEVVLTHEDITDWKQAQHNLQFLLEASGVLSASLDFETTLKNLAEFAVPDFADYCAVDLFEKESIRRVALTHRDPEKKAFIREMGEEFPLASDAPAGSVNVRRTGEAEMKSGISDELLRASIQNKQKLAFVRALNLKSYISVPLKARGETVGAITWVRDSRSPAYDEADFQLAKDLGHRASIAVENALLYQNATAALGAAKDANKAKDDFLAVVSHELRTPLSAISGWASLLRHDAVDQETRDQALEIIERNCFVQGRLVEDILEVSRIVGGTLKLELMPLDLAATIDTSLATIETTAATKFVQIEVHVERPVLINGDEVRLHQIITNLLSNAVKFTRENGLIQLSLSTSHSHATIEVADNGQGISSEFLPHVFDRFRQADGTSTRRYGGLGLGLAIVQHLVELHDGTIRAQSPGEGQGATFTVQIPLLSAHANRIADKSSTLADASLLSGQIQQDKRLSGLDILVVDDEPDAIK